MAGKGGVLRRISGLPRTFVMGAASLILAVALGFGLGAWLIPKLMSPSKTSDTLVVAALAREEKVVLLSLGVQGIVSEEVNTKVLGFTLPASERIQFIQYSYEAQLGVDGKGVKVEKTGDHAYRVTLPEFSFLGHDKEQFKVAVEKEGDLSWMTPKVDTASLITKVLGDGARAEQLAGNRELLQEQAERFYGGIITSVDSEAKVEMAYAPV